MSSKDTPIITVSATQKNIRERNGDVTFLRSDSKHISWNDGQMSDRRDESDCEGHNLWRGACAVQQRTEAQRWYGRVDNARHIGSRTCHMQVWRGTEGNGDDSPRLRKQLERPPLVDRERRLSPARRYAQLQRSTTGSTTRDHTGNSDCTGANWHVNAGRPLRFF